MIEGKQTANEQQVETRDAQFCFIHIGLPKTASTTLRTEFFPKHPQLEYLGKLKNKTFRDADITKILTSIERAPVDPQNVSEYKDLFAANVAPAMDQRRIPTWSEEGLAMGGRKKRLARANSMRQMLGDCKILFVLRHPIALLEAFYFQDLKGAQIGPTNTFRSRGHFEDFESWLNDWSSGDGGRLQNKGLMDYAHTARIYVDTFGRESVGVFLYERLVEDPAQYMDEICKFVGIENSPDVQKVGLAKYNIRWTEPQVEILKAISKSPIRRMMFRLQSDQQRRRTLGMTKRNRADGAKAHVKIPKEWQKRINEFQLPGNQWIAEQWGLPLQKYGYSM